MAHPQPPIARRWWTFATTKYRRASRLAVAQALSPHLFSVAFRHYEWCGCTTRASSRPGTCSLNDAQLHWLGPGIQYCVMGVYIALWAKAPSQPQPHRLADLTVDKADDHGVGGLLPAQVIPVVSEVGLEQILAELHRRPRRAIDLLGGRECCEIGALSAHADVADLEAVFDNELSDLYITEQVRWTDLARRVVEEHLHTPRVFVLPASQSLIQLDELLLRRLSVAHVIQVIQWPSATWPGVSYHGLRQMCRHFSQAISCLITAEDACDQMRMLRHPGLRLGCSRCFRFFRLSARRRHLARLTFGFAVSRLHGSLGIRV
eukprot:scaffold16965_cov69-Phaeocystis_antarctica.AAC.3